MFLAAEKLHAPRAFEIGLVDAIADDPIGGFGITGLTQA
jgi:hypothetical protein